MTESDDTAKKRIKEAQAIILEAFTLNGVDMADGMTAIFSTGIAMMKQQEISQEDFEDFVKDLIEGYKQIKKK